MDTGHKATDDDVQKLREELRLRELLTDYVWGLDRRDVDAVMSYFHDDCVVVNPRGSYAGREAIRANYEHLMARGELLFHLTGNVAVRLVDATEATMRAYYVSMLRSADGDQAVSGTYDDRLVKADGRWQIVERRIEVVFSHALTPQSYRMGGTTPDGSR
jgi:ketosteroid isomerase-like protein